MATATYGEPGKNPYSLKGIGGILSNVVNAETGVTQIYRQDAFRQFKSIGTYNPTTGTVVGDTTNLSTQEIQALSINRTNIRNASVSTAKAAGLDQTTASKLMTPNAAAAPAAPAAPADPNNGGTGTGGPGFDPNDPEQVAKLIGTRINKYETGKNPLIYPLKRQGYGGDYISFEIRTYQKSGLASPTAQGRTGTKDVTLVGMEKRQATTLAYIYLPIQSGISDSMSVDWGTGELSPITAAFANMAYSVINRAGQGDIGGYAKGAAKDFGNVLKGFGNASPELRAMMVNYFVEQSVGVNGLLSRTIGGAINNNLELLFNGPTLRSFTFNFKLTAREPEEAVLIKNIIRYFKKSMVPGLSQSKLFLLAPNVFKIKYVYTGKGDDAKGHPYLNKIKVAALRDMSVNYTPDGNYMTYRDGSMTQYDLSLTFGEIDPIYEPDYYEGEGLEGMGW